MPLSPTGQFVSLPEGFVLAERKSVPPAEESGAMVWAHVEFLGSKPQGERTAELPGPGGAYQVKASGAGVEVVTPQGKRIRALEELALHLFEEGTRNLEEAMKAVRRRKLEGGKGESHEARRGETPFLVEGGGDAAENEETEESRQEDALTASHDGEDGDSDDEAGNGGVENGADMIARGEPDKKSVKNGDEMIPGDQPLETEVEASREDDAEMSIDHEEDTEDGGEDVEEDVGADVGADAGGDDDGEGNGDDDGDDDGESDEDDGDDDAEGDGEDDEEENGEGDGEDAACPAFFVPNPEERLEARIKEELMTLHAEDRVKLNELDACLELTSHPNSDPVVLITQCEGFDKLERTVLGLQIACSTQQRLASEQTNFNAKKEEYKTFHETQKRKRSELLDTVQKVEGQLTKRLKLAKKVYDAHAGFLKSLPADSDEMFNSLPLKAAKEFDAKLLRCDIDPIESQMESLKEIKEMENKHEVHTTEKLVTVSTNAANRWKEQEADQKEAAEAGVISLPCVVNAYVRKSTEQHAAMEKQVARQKDELKSAEDTYLGFETTLAKTNLKNAKDNLRESEYHLEAMIQRDTEVCLKLNGLKSALEEMVKSLNDESRRLFDEHVKEGNDSRGSLNVSTQIKEIIEFLDHLNSIAPPPPRHTHRKWSFTSFLTGMISSAYKDSAV
mmetsp:Transcript_31893/g.66788  ORF Transcript_31893/g.66788 Transcript_31893/m.66788 type:complete len:676 (+) Transcript_31893:2-2029(+)